MAPHSDVEIAQSGTTQGRLTIAFLVLSWFFILLRTWTRTYVIHNFGWDDSTMILAGLIFSLYCAALLYMAANGGGTHITSIPQLQKLTKWVVVSEATYVMAMMILKISLGIFFGRIVAKRSHFLFIYSAVGLNIFSSAAAFFYVLFRCGANLDDYVIQQLKHKCTPMILDRFMAYQQAAFTTLTDLMFVLLPILILWNANMSRRSKISVGAILSLATVGCICSILRFRYVEGITKTDDFFWHAVNIAIWSTIECGTCIIAGCLAALRPLIKHIFKDTPVSSILSGCMKQISSSLKSSRRSTSSSTPHSNATITTTATTISEPLPPTRKQKNREAVVDTPTFMEFIAPPGQEVIPLHSDFDQERKSTDRILASPEPTVLEFPWPVRAKDKRRQTMHVNWTLRRGVGSDGRTCTRPASEPMPLGVYEMGRPPV